MCGDYLSARVRLAASVAIVAEPFGSAGAVPGKCWHNVNQLIQSFGGTLVYGWGLGKPGPISMSCTQRPPLYARWVNHALWRDESGQLWEATPVSAELDHAITWEPTHFILDDDARFEIATDDICCPRAAVYVAVQPQGEWSADCLCQAERATRDSQDAWIERAVYSLRQAGLQPVSWRARRVGDKLRDISIVVR
jgi:hypothetical protein